MRCTFLLSEEMGLRFWVLGENGFWISARIGFVGGLGLGGRVSREQPSSPVGTHRAEKEHVRRHQAVEEHVKTHWEQQARTLEAAW